MNEQGAQIDITVFGHRAQALFATRGMLSWREPQPGGELAAVAKHGGIADARHQCRRRDRPHALDLHQPLRRVPFGQRRRAGSAILLGERRWRRAGYLDRWAS